MNRIAFNLLRAGLAVTFIWIGVLVVQNPLGWGSFIQPWVLPYLPDLQTMMTQTGYLEIITGIMLLINPTVWLGALLGTIHLVIVLITCGINDITVRDIGLAFAFLALFVETMPLFMKNWLRM
ncbi:MAG: hypothetical protein Q7S19_03810 [bacterium]|nr:hypothetical protein [bacterium]